jgi:hypothetical protein
LLGPAPAVAGALARTASAAAVTRGRRVTTPAF